eukprot:TRINITY_DN599_c0_g2_i1.p2 TRINITY_DN599_c0_g2~~TRINITY_DN599_c0_g2_i1.p2  ORF type:complete len:221 (+),score=47.14 TRINITY_DN599_c0_g2_i1:61-723(+)
MAAYADGPWSGCRGRPPWRKQLLCWQHTVAGSCPVEGECTFAHGWAELAVPVAMCPVLTCLERFDSERQFEEHMRTHRRLNEAENLAPSVRADASQFEDNNNPVASRPKVLLCTLFTRGTCAMGERCRFAHSWAELSVQSVKCPLGCGSELRSEVQYRQHMDRRHLKLVCVMCGNVSSDSSRRKRVDGGGWRSDEDVRHRCVDCSEECNGDDTEEDCEEA